MNENFEPYLNKKEIKEYVDANYVEAKNLFCNVLPDEDVWNNFAVKNLSRPKEYEGRNFLSTEFSQLSWAVPFLKDDSIILDAGCGDGQISFQLLEKFNLSHLIAVDRCQKMLSLLRQTLAANERSNIQLFKRKLFIVNSALEKIPVLDQSVDVVLSISAIQYNPKEKIKDIVDEFYRILKPGGKLVLINSFPNFYNPQGPFHWIFEKVNSIDHGPIRTFSKKEVQHILSKFKVVVFKTERFILIPSFFERIKIFKKPVQHINHFFTLFMKKFFPRSVLFSENFNLVCVKE